MRLPCSKLAISLCLALGSAPVFAGSVSVDTDTATAGIQAASNIALNGTRDVSLVFNRAAPGEVVTSVSGNPGLSYDTAAFNVTSNNGSCTVNDPTGQVAFITLDFAGLADGAVICTLTFTNTAGAGGDVEPLTLSGVQPMGTTVNNGQLTLQAAAPPVLTFAPASGTIASGAGFSITPSGGQPGGSATYACTPTNAGTVNFTNGAGTINQGGAAVNVTATCANPGADQPITCTHTGGAGSTTSPVSYTVDCPAAPAPVLASTPANGTTLTCNGAPGAVVTTQATIQNTGNADMTGVSCNVTGTGFALTTAPSATIAAGGSSNAVVSCTVPAAGTNTGTLACTTTAPAGGALSFPLSSSGQTVPTFVQPDVIPANSLWSKLGLIGLLAVLGLLAVGFRRQ